MTYLQAISGKITYSLVSFLIYNTLTILQGGNNSDELKRVMVQGMQNWHMSCPGLCHFAVLSEGAASLRNVVLFTTCSWCMVESSELICAPRAYVWQKTALSPITLLPLEPLLRCVVVEGEESSVRMRMLSLKSSVRLWSFFCLNKMCRTMPCVCSHYLLVLQWDNCYIPASLWLL